MNFFLSFLSQYVLEFVLAVFFFTAIVYSNTDFVLVLKLAMLDITSNLPHIRLSHDSASIVVVP